MLAFLKVKGFAIIDELEVEFGEGLNVITGETGAGKSIIINALSTVLSPKISADVVRSNAQQAEVTGHFVDGADECILKRVINPSGRSRAFLNDEPVTVNKLEEKGNMLVNIYGQNESRYLLDKDSYVGIMDDLLSLTAERVSLSEKVEALRKVKGELDTKNKEVDGRTKEAGFLAYQIEEIERADLKEGEEEAIKEKLKILKDGERIGKALQALTEGMYDGEPSAHGFFTRFVSLLKPFSHIEAMEALRKRMEGLAIDVEDAVLEVRTMEKGLAYDPDELEALEARLSAIYELKSRYGTTYEDIRKYEGQARSRLTYLNTLSEAIEVLERQRDALEREVRRRADDLSGNRIQGARGIEKSIIRELSLLSMPGLRFEISITDRGTVDETGKDDIELLISTNPGEPLKPLRKTASGGELSRIMLAIKQVIGGEERKTLIFDEVDAGIGGRIADMVGKRLKELARTHQIICITHLPQIAVYGNHHYLVEKKLDEGVTKTLIRSLGPEERVAEIARMMAGAVITEKTIQRAEEMLQNA
jgi:DNA repair protein RecN (Recombination protein N)